MSRISVSLFFITILLSLIGLFLLYESSSYSAYLNIGDKHFFVKYQSIWIIAGICFSFVVSLFDYRKLYSLSLPLLIISFSLLILVFLPGVGIELKGANRWVDFRLFVVQPSELLKITFTLYLAAWFSNKEKNRIFAFFILLLAAVFLVAIEPDLGTALIVAVTAVVVYFLSGSRIFEMVIIFLFLIAASVLLIKMEPYRVARLTNFQNLDLQSLSGTSYHVKQILIALGSGGVTGMGFGNSIQKYAYLPENTTDSIFAIFAEEAGFLGSLVLISLFLIQVLIGFLIAVKTLNKFGRLLASGIITFLTIQAFINLASQVVLIPLTGVPLPFISYGGSSMMINFLSIGILMSIGNRISKEHVYKSSSRRSRLSHGIRKAQV